jgi:hypothetical protein
MLTEMCIPRQATGSKIEDLKTAYDTPTCEHNINIKVKVAPVLN